MPEVEQAETLEESHQETENVEEPIESVSEQSQPEHTKPVLKLAAIPEPKQGSWASAIAPKTKPKPKTVSKPVPQPEESKPEEHIPVQEEAQPVESVLEDKPAVEAVQPVQPPVEDEPVEAPAASSVAAVADASFSEPTASSIIDQQPQVVLPTTQQQVDSVGISFDHCQLMQVNQRKQQKSYKMRLFLNKFNQNNNNNLNNSHYKNNNVMDYTTNNQPNKDINKTIINNKVNTQATTTTTTTTNKSTNTTTTTIRLLWSISTTTISQQTAQPGAQFGGYPGSDYNAYNQQAFAAVAAPAASHVTIGGGEAINMPNKPILLILPKVQSSIST